MRKTATVLLIVLAPVAALAETAELAEPQTASEQTAGDIVIHGFDGTLRLRLFVTLDGLRWQESVDAADRKRLRSMFERLDADGDGRLSSAEARRAPSPRSLGDGGDESGVYVAFNFRVLDANGDGGTTIEELSDYVSEFSQPALSLDISEARQTGRGRALFDVLDSDRDDRLTPVEWSDHQ